MSTTESTDLVVKTYEALPASARERWTVEDLRTILATVFKGLVMPEAKMVLNIADQYNLNPLLREIWAVKSKSGRLLILVGRDGLLRNARRQADYAGFDTDVVRAKDVFSVERQPDGQRKITHSYSGGTEERGEILGAWAQVYQHGKSSTYFFAPWDEYRPKNSDQYSPWTNQPSVMIQKCALSLCLRLAFNLSGVVGEDEAANVFESDSITSGEGDGQPQGLDLGSEVEAILARAAELGHAGLSDRATAEVALGQRSPAAVSEWVARAASELDRHEADAVRRRQDADAEVSDADVVGPDVPIDIEDLPEPSSPDAEVLRRRLSDLLDRTNGGDLTPEETEMALEEIGYLEGELASLGGAVPGQLDLGAQ